MKTLLTVLCTLSFAAACTENNGEPGTGDTGTGDTGSGDTGGTGTGSGSGSGSGGTTTTADCVSDSCVCPDTTGCEHACDPGGAPCHVQCAFGEDCDVTCEASEECHVEALTSTTVTVDCAGAAECHVTCPATGCTVENCVGADCIVSCGYNGDATITGTTARCL